MSLTKATNRMISGAEINVLDFGADPTGATDSTNAFNLALLAGSRIYIPEGNYSITSISFPQKRVFVYGDGIDATIITGSGSVVFDFQHSSENYLSRHSSLETLKVIAQSGNTALRINNLGIHIKNCRFQGGDIGIEVNSSVSCVWEFVKSYGSVYGIKLSPATFNLGSQGVFWLNNINRVSCSGNSISDAATAIYTSGANFARHNTFNQLDMEQIDIGFDFVGNSCQQNVFINPWSEYAISYYGREGSGSSNLWISPSFIPSPSAPTNGVSYDDASNQLSPGAFTAKSQGGSTIGQIRVPSINQYIAEGFDVIANTSIANQNGLYPFNQQTAFYSQLEYFSEVKRSYFYDTSGAVPFDVATVELNTYGACFLDVELVENRGTTLSGYLKYQRVLKDDGSSSMTITTINSDSKSSYCDVVITALSRNSFKITITDSSGLSDRAGISIRVASLVNSGSQYGVKFV